MSRLRSLDRSDAANKKSIQLSLVHKSMCDRFQNPENEGETAEDAGADENFLVSEEVQFANLEKSFREVSVYFHKKSRDMPSCGLTKCNRESSGTVYVE